MRGSRVPEGRIEQEVAEATENGMFDRMYRILELRDGLIDAAFHVERDAQARIEVGPVLLRYLC